MVSGLDSGWRGLASSPGQGHCVVFLRARHFIIAPSLVTDGAIGDFTTAVAKFPMT